MKLVAIAAAGVLAVGGAADAQSPSNATIMGSQTAPSNGSGMPSPAAPTGQLSAGGVGVQTSQLPGDRAANQPTTQDSTSTPATTPTK